MLKKSSPFPHQTPSAGFTLIEIMIVVVLMGVLASIAALKYQQTMANVRQKKAEADVEILSSAIHQLANDTGEWPAGITRTIIGNAETWDLSTGAAGLAQNDGRFSHWRGPYIDFLPTDPWGSPYFFDPDYTVGSDTRSVVGSFGPNRAGRNVYDSDNIYVIVK